MTISDVKYIFEIMFTVLFSVINVFHDLRPIHEQILFKYIIRNA